MILDTSFIIDLLKNRRESVSKMKQLTEDGVPYMITAPTVFELWSGLVSLGKSETEKQKTVSLIREQIIYPLDEESARIAGNIDGELIKKGLKTDPIDVMIAGIAISNNKKVLTRDEHFARIEGLKVEGY